MSLSSTGKCPPVPEFLCAVCYDEKDCDRGDWSPLDIPIFPKAYKLKGGPKNGIESCSVRKGCSLTLVDTDKGSFRNAGNLTVSASGADKHFNLDGNKDKKFSSMSNDAEEVICSCGITQNPVFAFGL